MRLSELQKSAIVQSARRLDPAAEVWLFGSRVDDHKKGGDIDLMIVSLVFNLPKKIDFLVEVKTKIGDQKVDVHLVKPDAISSDPFALAVLPEAVRLTPVLNVAL